MHTGIAGDGFCHSYHDEWGEDKAAAGMGQRTSDDKLSRGHYNDLLALVLDWSVPSITYTSDYQTVQTDQDRYGVWGGFYSSAAV